MVVDMFLFKRAMPYIFQGFSNEHNGQTRNCRNIWWICLYMGYYKRLNQTDIQRFWRWWICSICFLDSFIFDILSIDYWIHVGVPIACIASNWACDVVVVADVNARVMIYMKQASMWHVNIGLNSRYYEVTLVE